MSFSFIPNSPLWRPRSSQASPSRNFLNSLAHRRRQAEELTPGLFLPAPPISVIQLNAVLPTFLEYLAHPTIESISKACDWVEKHGKSRSLTSSPRSEPPSQQSPLSPMRRLWFANETQNSSHSDKDDDDDDDDDWMHRVSIPLQLFAAAEVLVQDLVFLRLRSSSVVVGLYRIVLRNLQGLQQDSVTEIDECIAVCQGRLQMVESLHTPITVMEEDVFKKSQFYQRVHGELLAHKYLRQAMGALEQCRFLETVVSLKKLQSYLPASQETCQSAWLHQSYHSLVASMRLYFDRANLFATPLYGLTNHLKKEPSPLETQVLDFLKKLDKAGGPATAVAIVLNAESSDQFHPERGFQITPERPIHPTARERWPAVFLRSSLYSIGKSSSYRGSAVSLAPLTRGGSQDRSIVSLATISRRSSAGSSDFSTGLFKSSAPADEVQARHLIMEYGSTDHDISWPHSDWDALVGMLDRDRKAMEEKKTMLRRNSMMIGEKQSPQRKSQQHMMRNNDTLMYRGPVTYRDKNETMDESLVPRAAGGVTALSSLFRAPAELIAPLGQKSEATDGAPTETKCSSTLHLQSLSPFTTLVVFSKTETGARRRQRTNDEDIHKFMGTLASKLRPRAIFSPYNIPESQLPLKANGDIGLDLSSYKDWVDNDHTVHRFLRDFRQAMGLRAERSSSPWWNSSGRTSSKKRNHVLDEGAAALFLGPELCQRLK